MGLISVGQDLMEPCPCHLKRPQRPPDDYLEAAVAAAAAAASAAALADSAAASADALAASTVAEAAVAAAEVAASAAELAASTAALAAWLAAAAASAAAASAAGAAAGASTGAGAGAASSFLPQADRATAATRAARTTEFFISVSYLDRQIKKISPSVPLFFESSATRPNGACIQSSCATLFTASYYRNYFRQ